MMRSSSVFLLHQLGDKLVLQGWVLSQHEVQRLRRLTEMFVSIRVARCSGLLGHLCRGPRLSTTERSIVGCRVEGVVISPSVELYSLCLINELNRAVLLFSSFPDLLPLHEFTSSLIRSERSFGKDITGLCSARVVRPTAARVYFERGSAWFSRRQHASLGKIDFYRIDFTFGNPKNRARAFGSSRQAQAGVNVSLPMLQQ